MTTARKAEILKIFAAVKGRRELEKDLAKHRKQFQDAKALYSATSTQLNDLQQVADRTRQTMEAARKGIVNITDSLQTMDLTGSNAARDRGDTRTYMVDGKEYHVDKSDTNDIKMTPWKEYKTTQQIQECMESSDASDMEVEDVAQAADAFAAMCE